ncbi:MAG: DUF1801 domain-containing protein [Granulosicoccus sp.]
MKKFSEPVVRKAYESLPAPHKRSAYQIRDLIWQTVGEIDLNCEVLETLKWGEPAYLPVKPRIGSTVRVGQFDDQNLALYFNCQTMLVENFRSMFGDDMKYSKNRAVLFNVAETIPEAIVKTCVSSALRYHMDKRLA